MVENAIETRSLERSIALRLGGDDLGVEVAATHLSKRRKTNVLILMECMSMSNSESIAAEEDIHVLLVEDHPPTQEAMSKLMKGVGVEVRCVSTVKQGIEELAKIPTLVVLDLMLPDGNGLEVLTEMRRRSLQSKVAIVTGASDEDMLEKVRALRPSIIFKKPLDMDDFISWICEPAPQDE